MASWGIVGQQLMLIYPDGVGYGMGTCELEIQVAVCEKLI